MADTVVITIKRSGAAEVIRDFQNIRTAATQMARVTTDQFNRMKTAAANTFRNFDLGEFKASMDLIQQEVGQVDERLKSVGRSFTIGLTIPIAGIATVSVMAAAQMDKLRRGMVAVTGSTEEADRQLELLKETAKLPGLGFREAIQGSINLQAAGMAADSARRTLEAFGNAVATVGGGKAELDGVTLALTQMLATGKVLGQEVRQLQQRIPQIRQVMIDAFGTGQSEEIQKMNISTEEFIQKITESLEKLPKVTGGIANAFENLEDSIFRARNALGESLLPIVTPVVDGLSGIAEGISKSSENSRQWAIAIGAVAAAIGPALIAIYYLRVAWTGLAAAMTLGMAPMALLVAALAALGVAAVKLGLDWIELQGATKDVALTFDTLAAGGTAVEQQLARMQAQADATAVSLDGLNKVGLDSLSALGLNLTPVHGDLVPGAYAKKGGGTDAGGFATPKIEAMKPLDALKAFAYDPEKMLGVPGPGLASTFRLPGLGGDVLSNWGGGTQTNDAFDLIEGYKKAGIAFSDLSEQQQRQAEYAIKLIRENEDASESWEDAINGVTDAEKRAEQQTVQMQVAFIHMFGSMVEEAIAGADNLVQAFSSTLFSSAEGILAAKGHPVIGAVVGVVGGIINGLFRRNEKEKQEEQARRDQIQKVRIEEMSERARQSMDNGPKIINVQILDSSTGEKLRDIRYQIGRETARDAVQRLPAGAEF